MIDIMIDIFTSEDMENISLCIFQYLTLYYIINGNIFPHLFLFSRDHRHEIVWI